MKRKSSAKSAFFNPRTLFGLFLCFVGILLALLAFSTFTGRTAQAQGAGQNQSVTVRPLATQTVTPVEMNLDLRELPQIPDTSVGFPRPVLRRHPPASNLGPVTNAPIPGGKGPKPPAPSAPATNIGFDGIDETASGCACSPPDEAGDTSTGAGSGGYYIQAVNVAFKIWDKTGTVLLATTTFNSLWGGGQGTNAPCFNNEHFGDPYVFYDQQADRWVLTDFAFRLSGQNSVPPYYQCIAVSKTNNPVSGGWFLYAFQADTVNTDWLNDYPKFGMWPDAWYETTNMFCGNGASSCANGTAKGSFEGVEINAYNRSQMLAGQTTTSILFRLTPAQLGDSYSFLPANFRFGTPPSGRNEFFAAIDSPATAQAFNTLNTVHIWKEHVDFTTPANSTLTGPTDITVNGFTDAWDSTENTAIVPQSGTTTKLDTVGDRLFTPLWYQNLNGTESLWATHTINDTNVGATAVRWYQFNVTNNTVQTTPVQQGDINLGDGLYRWMPSLTVDKNGDMGIGYDTSSSSSFPTIRYNGRLTSDALGTLGQGETIMISGTAAWTGSTRWGDYAVMNVDPNDGCTFWHANEYKNTSGGSDWNTHIGNFAYAQCAGTGTLTGTVTNSSGGAPISGATVTAGPNTTTTNGSGVYTFSGITAGTYNMTVTATNFNSGSASGVVVNSGNTTTKNFQLTSVPTCGGLNVWCSVTGTTGSLFWNSTTTWDKGTVPTAGADVIIRPFSGTYSNNNFVALNGSATPHSIEIQAGANAGIGGTSGTETFTVSGNFTIDSGSPNNGLLRDVAWTGSAQTYTLQVGGNFTNNGTMGGVSTSAKYGITVEFNGTAAQTVGGTGGITALGGSSSPSTAFLVSNTSSGGVTFTSNVNTNNGGGIAASTTINSGATVLFGSSSNQFTGAGTLTLNGSTQLKAATFNGHYGMTGTRTISTGSTITYTNTASTITPTTDIPSATLGNLIIDTSTGSATLGASITVSGNLTINSGTLSAGANNITLNGNWINPFGTFSGGTGTVTLSNNADHTIMGSTTFHNLTDSAIAAHRLTLDATGTQTITGTMTLQGVSGQLLALRSSSGGSQAAINPQGARTIAFLDVQDSDNVNSTKIDARGTNSTDSGNNTGWIFLNAPTLASASSRMTHGSAGTFDLPLALSSRTVEMRGATNDNLTTTGNFTTVFTFNEAVNSGTASVTAGTGTAGTPTFSGSSMIVPLSGVTDQQTVTVTASNVSGPTTATLGSASVQIGFLWGDVNQDGFVNVGDTTLVRGSEGQTTNSTNFKYDVNVSGVVDSTDTTIVKNNSGDFLP
jgi:hypothetical protein